MEKGVAELPHGESDQGCCHGWKFVVYVQPPKPASQRIATMTTMRYAILSAFGRAGGSTTVSTIAFTRRSESQTQSRKSRNPNMHYSFAAEAREPKDRDDDDDEVCDLERVRTRGGIDHGLDDRLHQKKREPDAEQEE